MLVTKLSYQGMVTKADVLIVGAGAAGLACAEHLLKENLKIQILEARQRIGGRAYSYESKAFAQPIEFGAEFIHGAPKEILDRLTSTEGTFVDVIDKHLWKSSGRLQPQKDFWKRLEQVTARLNPKRKYDRSVQEFLNQQGKKISPDLKKIFKAYVEGFQAADLNLIGERALAQTEQDQEGELNQQGLFRLSHGYTHFMNEFLKNEELKSALHLGALVQEIHWQPDSVQARVLEQGQQKTYAAKAVVITVPLGVLKSPQGPARIRINPEIPQLQKALDPLYMGHVQRIAFDFDERFWERLSKEQVGFLHAGPEHYFPTWWTQMPVRSSVLIAWQGGPKAAELGEMDIGERVDCAFTTLSYLTGHSKTFFKKHLRAYYTHNWSEDPYSLGAYSFNGVEAEKSQKRLQKDFGGVVYIAGEATAVATAQGTVHGALSSGVRAAHQVLRRLMKKS